MSEIRVAKEHVCITHGQIIIQWRLVGVGGWVVEVGKGEDNGDICNSFNNKKSVYYI